MSGQVELIVAEEVVPRDITERASDLDVSPRLAASIVSRDVRRRKAAFHVLQFDTIAQQSSVSARAGVFYGHGGIRFAVLVELPEDLRVAEEQHAVGAPVIEDIREDIDVHELAVRLSGADLLPLSVRMTKPD